MYHHLTNSGKSFIYLKVIRSNEILLKSSFKCVAIVQGKARFKEVKFLLHMISFIIVKVNKTSLLCDSLTQPSIYVCRNQNIIIDVV